MNLLSYLSSIGILIALLSACQQLVQPSPFKRNAAIAERYLRAYEAEHIPYDSFYADGFALKGTWNGAPDSLYLEETKAHDSASFAMFDFKILTDPLVFLPGMDENGRHLNNSVRYYGVWEVTRHATDSTEEKKTTIQLYESFEFDQEGRITYQQYYGDFGGMQNALLN